MKNIRLNVPEEVAALIGDSPEERNRRALEIIVLDLYRRHEISARRAAGVLDMEFLAFARWSGERGIPYFDMTPEELQQELRALEAVDRPDSRS